MLQCECGGYNLISAEVGVDMNVGYGAHLEVRAHVPDLATAII